MDTLQKLEALINYNGKMSNVHKTEALKLRKKLLIVGDLSLMEGMSVDSLLDIYEITEAVLRNDKKEDKKENPLPSIPSIPSYEVALNQTRNDTDIVL